MRYWKFGWVLALWLMACESPAGKQFKALHQQPDNGLVQHKNIGNIAISCTYLPIGWQRSVNDGKDENDNLLTFRINVSSADASAIQKMSAQQVASFGLDTLFQLIADNDTLIPVYAERVANGNIGGPEYLVAFHRSEKVSKLQLVYKDWIYSGSRLFFPLQQTLLQQSDSLSLAL
ncbi:hypothetical protein [Chitinophaga sp. HK235]|uniref:hypothetical protein n=1 Tax=Chitinophaga sp. HK235 TaxID=2952571 RepID=UPI001BA91794|nr:hypothetical protein [Chitinophaga sp. HK235]